MPDIILTTLNARYIHTAFGLRYLLANLGPLKERAQLLEYDIKNDLNDVANEILALGPTIVGIGVYIWNVMLATKLVQTLKRACPELMIVLGGPEVSFETEAQDICGAADYVITGEADIAFAELCNTLLNGSRPVGKVIEAPPVDPAQLALPYDLYTEDDIAHRLIYVEASRGCPYRCEYCISSHDIPLRYFAQDRIFDALEQLLNRGVTQFKFVDRTFNVHMASCLPIMRFFLERYRPGMFVHFEMAPDRFPTELRELLKQFPEGALQLEIGVQTLNPEVSERIQRKQDMKQVIENLDFLRKETNVHIHADLIAGLPGESLESFRDGFDRLVALRPQKIQVGILKRLHGAPISRHNAEWQMVYEKDPPYSIVSNSLIDEPTMRRIRRFARYWELIANRSNFTQTLSLLWKEGTSDFESFMELSDWLHTRFGREHSVALDDLTEGVFDYLTREAEMDTGMVAEKLWKDYGKDGKRRRPPKFLAPHLP